MTVSTTTNKVSYIGNGVATSFAIPFPFLEQGHLKAYQLLNNVQTERTDWTVSGGNIIFTTAPTDGAQIVIMREVPLTQETDYRENEVLPAETLERNFDKLTMQVQQLKEQADRAVTVDVFDDTKAASLIPSIRQAVSDCAGYASTASDKAQQALTQAQNAANNAQNAATSATDSAASAANAANSETHTASMLETKANIDADNFSSDGKKTLASLGKPYYANKITIGTQGSWSNYTCPTSGFILITGGSDSNYVTISINGTEYSSKRGTMLIPVNNGNYITKVSSAGTNAAYFVTDIGG